MWGSALELFVEAAGPMLVEAHVAAGALVPSVAVLGSGEAAGEMGGEASGVLYRPSQSYYPVDLEGGLLRDMLTPSASPGECLHETPHHQRPLPSATAGTVLSLPACPRLS